MLVSCGFDAGEGDFMGGYHVTPACYAHMTRQLMGVSEGKVVLALEGGMYVSNFFLPSLIFQPSLA